MPRAPASIRQSDVERIMRAAVKSGLPFARVDVDLKTGRVSFLPAGAEPADDDDLDAELREWRSKRDG